MAMTRWLSTCTLVRKLYEPDDEGVMHAADEAREVFCNEYSIGHSTWSSMYEIGISADAELQVWEFDYDGQKDVVYGGDWYSVERAYTDTSNGDCVRLVLRRQASDGADPAPEPPQAGSPKTRGEDADG